MSKDVVIVGNGLFGSVAATLARSRGHNVTVVSNMEPMAASKASGCVLAPSWLSSLAAQDIDNGLRVLDDLYGLEDLPLHNAQTGIVFKAQRVDPDKVRVKPDIVGDVLKVGNGTVELRDQTLRGFVLVAAGVWTDRLVPNLPRMRGLYGASVRFKGHLPTARIHVYAPYRQAVAFQLNRNEVWFGDGTALVRKTWETSREQRIAATIKRGWELCGFTEGGAKALVNEGIRPYVEGHKAGYFDKLAPKTWVSTGGAKNGTLLAAAQALRFIEEARL